MGKMGQTHWTQKSPHARRRPGRLGAWCVLLIFLGQKHLCKIKSRIQIKLIWMFCTSKQGPSRFQTELNWFGFIAHPNRALPIFICLNYKPNRFKICLNSKLTGFIHVQFKTKSHLYINKQTSLPFGFHSNFRTPSSANYILHLAAFYFRKKECKHLVCS